MTIYNKASLIDYLKEKIEENQINEYNHFKREENKEKCLKFVEDYFENMAIKSKVSWLDKEREEKFKQYQKHRRVRSFEKEQQEWLFDKYLKYNGSRFDDRIHWIFKTNVYNYLVYKKEDYEKMVNTFLNRYKKDFPEIINEKDIIESCFKTHHKYLTKDKPFDLKMQLNEKINSWLNETLSKYGVDLVLFANRYTYEFVKKFDRLYNYNIERDFCKNYDGNLSFKEYRQENGKEYNFKNNDNLFEINELYERIKDKPFIFNKKDLEVLLMYASGRFKQKEIDNYIHKNLN